jgi:photosystem II stability/assembly factor-like uncharacterized protein
VILAALACFATAPRLIDLDGDTKRQVVVDREAGQYLGHPTTVLLRDGRTMLAVYPKGHGKGPIQLKRSPDGGKTWSGRLPTPASWETGLETPTIHRTIDPRTKRERLILWSGLNPARLASSEDEGKTWTELKPAGTWGGIVVMSSIERLRNGDYLALFHDDGRYFYPEAQSTGVFTVYKTYSHDGGATWTFPEAILSRSDMQLCEPGLIRSPDGKTLAMLLRENSRKFNSQIIFSHDEGKTWSVPRALPRVLTGDRHVGKVAPDGRLLISFRDMPPDGEWKGDWVAWVGTWGDLENGRPGEYKIRLKDNREEWDSGYPAVECLSDGTFVLTSYGHWIAKESPYVLSVRLKLSELPEFGN